MTGERGGPVVLAVDFGTTNTVGVARWGHRAPSRVVVDGAPSMPSAVLLGHDGSLIIGQDAVRLGRAAAARLELRPKSRLDEETILLGDRTVTVLEVVRAVLARLCGEVRTVAGAPVEHLVLTHPADWGAVRLGRFARAATGLAARISLVPEPVAAAAHAGRSSGGTRAVLDFGGGTCDAAVVRAGGPDPALGYAVLACAGLPDLGGDDLDQRIVDLVLGRCPSVAGRLGSVVSTSDVHVLRDRLLLRQDARAAKELLSRHDLARVAVPGLDEPVVVHRAEFDRIVAADLERAVTLLEGVRHDARAAVDEVLLVGGSSRIPALGESLRGRLAVPVTIAREPESAVAFGALAVTGVTERTAAHPVVSAPPAPAREPAPVPEPPPDPPPDPPRPRSGRGLPVLLAALVVPLAALLVWYASGSGNVTGSPVGSSTPRGPAKGTPVTGPSAPPPRTVPSGQSGRVDTQQLGIEVRVDRIAADTTAPAPEGYRWVRADVTVTLREGYHDLAEATPMRLVDDRGQRILPARGDPAVRAGCAAPLPSVALGRSRTECQLFLVPNATPVVGVMYDQFSGTEVNRGGFVAAAELPATGTTDLPGIVGRVGDPAREVDLGHGRFVMGIEDVVEAPSEYLTEDSRPMNGGRYVVVRMTVKPSGGREFRDEDFTFVRLLDDRGLPVPEEHLTPAELVDCPPAHRVRPGDSATACLVFTIGTRTPVAAVAYVGETDHDVRNWRTWRLG